MRGEPAKAGKPVGCRSGLQLGAVTTGELTVPIGLMPVPAAQCVARGHVLQPFVVLEIGLLDAPRPEPIDEYAIAPTMVFPIDPFEFDVALTGHGLSFLCQSRHRDQVRAEWLWH